MTFDAMGFAYSIKGHMLISTFGSSKNASILMLAFFAPRPNARQYKP